MKTCYLCGGSTERREVTAQNWWGTELTLVTGVPAEVCTQCGEQYFDADIAVALDRLHDSGQRPERMRSVPEYTFAGH